MQRLHVDKMLAELSSGELAEWEEFYQLEPWGGLVEDLRSARAFALQYNSKKKRSTRALKVEDARFGKKAALKIKRMTGKAMLRTAEALVASMGGRDKRKKRKE